MSDSELELQLQKEARIRRLAEANVIASEKKLKKVIEKQSPQTILAKQLEIQRERVEDLVKESTGLFTDYDEIVKLKAGEHKLTDEIAELLTKKTRLERIETSTLIIIGELRNKIVVKQREVIELQLQDEQLVMKKQEISKMANKLSELVHQETLKKNSLNNVLNTARSDLSFALQYQTQLNNETRGFNNKYLGDLEDLEKSLTETSHEQFDLISTRFKKLKTLQAVLPELARKHQEKLRRRQLMVDDMREQKKFVLTKNRARVKRQSNAKLNECQKIIDYCNKKIWFYATAMNNIQQLLEIETKNVGAICLSIKQTFYRNGEIFYQLINLRKLIMSNTDKYAEIEDARNRTKKNLEEFARQGKDELEDLTADINLLKEKIKNCEIQVTHYEFLPKLFFKMFQKLFRLIRVTHDVIPFEREHMANMDYTNYDFVITKIEEQITFLLCKLYHLEKKTPIHELNLQIPIFRIRPSKRPLIMEKPTKCS